VDQLTKTSELFFHTDRSGWESPPDLLITMLKIKSETGGETILVDGQQVIEFIKTHHADLYDLVTHPKYSSFRADDGSFHPRPLYSECSDLLRFRFDDGIQLSASLIDRFTELRSILFEHAYAISLEPGQSYVVNNHRFLHGRTSFTGSRELLRVLAYSHTSNEIKPILFDVDGTLCRSEALSIDAYYRCVSDVVGHQITCDNTKVNLHGQTDLSLLQDILRYHDLDESKISSAVQEFFKLHPRYLETSLARGFRSEPCPEVNEILDWLAAQQREHAHSRSVVPLGLLTGNSQANALLKIRAACINPNLFDLSISSFGDKHSSRLSLVQSSISKLETHYGTPVPVANVTLIGDTPLDIECAKKAGCAIVAVTTGNYTREQLAPLQPDVVCERLTEAKGFFSTIMCCA